MTFNAQQVQALLKPIHRSRVLRDNKGMTHVSQQDVRAHLTRIFGFGGWSSEIRDLSVVREAPGLKDGKEKGWAVTYRCLLRLTIRDPHGQEMCSYEDVGTGTSPNLPTLGDAHDFACKVAVSMALKRAATNLGDGFGLSLYNKGQTSALVIGTLVHPSGNGVDVSEQVPDQVSLGNDDAGSQEPEVAPATPAPAQGPVKRKAERGVAAEDPWAEHPVAVIPATDEAWVKNWETHVLAPAQSEQAFTVAWETLTAAFKEKRLTPDDANGCRLALDEARGLWQSNGVARSRVAADNAGSMGGAL